MASVYSLQICTVTAPDGADHRGLFERVINRSHGATSQSIRALMTNKRDQTREIKDQQFLDKTQMKTTHPRMDLVSLN